VRDKSWSGAFISILNGKKISQWEELAGGMEPEERELSFFLCESLAGVFLLSMHAPKKSGWMETAAESGRGFPGLCGDHLGPSFHASASRWTDMHPPSTLMACMILEDHQATSIRLTGRLPMNSPKP
jgi:hypothetical protein